MFCARTHLVREVEVRVHLDHLPAAVTVLIDSYEEARVILFSPLNVKMCCLRVAWNHIPIQTNTIIYTYIADIFWSCQNKRMCVLYY